LVRGREAETAEKVIAGFAKMQIAHPTAENVTGLIRRRGKGPRQFSELNCEGQIQCCSRRSAAAAYTVPAGDSGVDGAAALPPGALFAAGCGGDALVRAADFRGAIADFGFLAAPAWQHS
jgi:hypothetical protein